jgi:hypothetical protein
LFELVLSNMPRKSPELDLDFNIYVDPSCLSEPMADETPAIEVPPSPEEVRDEPVIVPDTPEEPAADEAKKDAEETTQGAAAEKAQEASAPELDSTPVADAVIEEHPEAAATVEEEAANTPLEEPSAPEVEDTVPVTAEADENPATADNPVPDPSSATEAAADAEPVEEPVTEPAQFEEPATNNAVADPETEHAAEADTEEATRPKPEGEAAIDTTSEPKEQESVAQEEVMATAEDEQQDAPSTEMSTETVPAEPALPREAPEEAQDEGSQDLPAGDADSQRREDTVPDADEEDRGSQRTFVDRKTSLRTEALIQAAARAVVAKIEKRKSGESVNQEGDEFETSLLSTGSQETYTLGDDAQTTHDSRPSSSRRESTDTHIRHIPSRSISSDDAGDSSSHHEPDDDVFSDRSARSSLCSLDAHDIDVKTPQAKEHLSRRESYASSTTTTHHSPRAVSGFSTISGLSQYEDKHFIPTSRETRMPFRTPSEIRAMQMASPTPSVFNGSSPRSSKRIQQQSFSRVGSPTVSAQYSPKNRSTPPRFKARKEAAPLVLLHVTLLPLRWVWGEILNGMDALMQGSKALSSLEDGTTATDSQLLAFEPSEQLKTLRDAWRELQDRVGDTVLERGILLPHPQNDYEVLEERLLEALELPVRRRARILECGHYLGPANYHSLEEESEDEDEVHGGNREEKRHWCNTCRNEIRYEDLGPGKVFRVKVYASNGLMRAGAWEACWKEMERVDVEVEPIVELAVQNELERMGALQLELEELQRRQEMELGRTPEPETEVKRGASPEDLRAPSRQEIEPDMEAQRALMSSPAPSGMQLTQFSTSFVRAATPNPYQAPSRPAEPIDISEERRRRDEERLREIYGDAGPAPVPAQLPAPPAPTQPAVDHHPQTQLYPQSQALTTAVQPQMPLLTDGSSQSVHRHHSQPPHHDAYSPHPSQREDPYERDRHHHEREREQRDKPRQQHTRPIVLDENSGFVELLMEAFKVLLRDPKNVAIIVLCVFVVVMIKSPGVAVENGLQPVSGGAPAVPVAGDGGGAGVASVAGRLGGVPVAQVQVQGQVQVDGQGGHHLLPEAEVIKEVEELVQGNVVGLEKGVKEVAASAAMVEFEKSTQVPSADVSDSADVVSPEPEVVSDVEERARDAEAEQQTLETEAITPGQEIRDAEATVDEEETMYKAADVCALRGLEYPVTLVGEDPILDEAEAEGADEAEAEDGSSLSAGVVEAGEQDVVNDSASTDNEAEAVAVSLETEEAETASPGNECSAPTPSTDDTDTEIEHEQPADDRCEADLDLDTDEHLPTTTPSASTTSLFIPGPFVTERKTVRVFETVTETVRVSVVTQTETVSTVVTAVPQTVEETVYETETVKITVSVPVEEQMAGKGKAKATKGCKKGWF